MTRASRRLVLPLVIVGLIGAATGAYAQFGGRFGGRFGFRRVPPRYADKDSFDGRYVFCRLQYESAYREAGGQGWTTDYPDADINFSIRLSELTKTPVSFDRAGNPNFYVVPIMDDSLFKCPFVVMSDAGTSWFEPEEADRLREYLLKGGFLWADDFWGSAAWGNWELQIGKVLPRGQYPIIDIPMDHPLFRMWANILELPQIPSIQHWRRSTSTSERGRDSAVVHFRAITDAHDRIMVFMTHNTDIADGWEREAEDPNYFYEFSPRSYEVGINAMLYMMSH